MSWNKKYQEASFRGISFHVLRAPSEFGRNKVVHEFPYSEVALIEDLGKKAKRFEINGFLIGEDYDFTRDLLINAAEEIGSGQLIHPYLGVKQVECLSLRVDESFREGNFAKIAFKFIEARTGDFQKGFVDSALELMNTADQFILSAAQQFAESFSVFRLPGYIVDSAASLVDKMGDFILSQNGLGASYSSISGLSLAITKLKLESKSLVRSPQELADKVSNALSDLSNNFPNKGDSIEAILNTANFPKTESSPLFDTKNRRIEKENQDLFHMLINNLSIGNAAKVLGEYIRDPSLGIQRVSINEVTSLRDQILLPLEGTLADSSRHPKLFNELLLLKTKLLKAVPGALELPEAKTVKVQELTSAFVLSYKLYGTADRAMELVERNSIANPAFITPGTEIEYVK